MANIQLRPYQTQAIAELRSALAAPASSALLVLPTGAGKTTVAAELTRLMVLRTKKVWFVAHLQELIEQARERMELFGLSVGEIAADAHYWPKRPVQCCMVITLAGKLRRGEIAACDLPDFIFVDEGHHSASNSYARIFEAAPNARRIALTATPTRLDGKGLGQWYETIVAPISAGELVALGHLCPARYYATETDLEGISTRGGEYAAEEVFKKFNRSKLYSGVVTNYENFADGKKAIVFCVSVEHSLATVQAFNDRGIPAAHLDGKTPKDVRKRVLAEFKAGKWAVLSNVSLFLEGFDAPGIECVIFNRPTKSRSLWLQGVGRALRPAPGKECAIIIDHGANLKAHGFFDDEVEHSLEDRKKKTTVGVVPMKSCLSCASMIHAGLRTCIWCGYEYPDERGKTEEAVFVEVSRQFLPPTVAKRKQFKAVPPDLENTSPYDWSAADWERVRVLCGYKRNWQTHQTAWQKVHGQQQEAAAA